MTTVAAIRCRPSKQVMTPWGAERWSQGAQVFCQSAMGGELELRFKVAEAGEYRVELHATRAPDYGNLEVWLNGKQVGSVIGGFAPRVEPTGAIPLGNRSFETGAQEVRFVVAGKNPSSSNYFFGIDCLDLIPVDSSRPR
jgi:hypothetical protein